MIEKSDAIIMAKKLINDCYDISDSQIDAVEKAEQIVLSEICMQINKLYRHVYEAKKFDTERVKLSISKLKAWQLMAEGISMIKTNTPF